MGWDLRPSLLKPFEVKLRKEMRGSRQSQYLSPVFTGIGAVSPFGLGTEKLWGSLESGRSAMTEISLFPTEKHRTGVAAEIKSSPLLGFQRLNRDLLSRADLFAVAASSEALLEAGLIDQETGTVSPLDSEKMGIVVGTAAGGILGLEEFFRRCAAGDLQTSSPLNLLSSFCLSSISTNIAKEFLIKGPRLTLATVCSSSGLALAAAKEMLDTGEADQVLVVGTETLSEVVLAGFNSLRSVAPDCCRPFDLNRRGIVLGEGAGALILESFSSASERKAEPLASLRGYGLTTDHHHFTAPQPEGLGISKTINQALQNASVSSSDIDYIAAHGTGTTLNDAAETRGIKESFGRYALKPAISSIKSMLGHQLGAASIFQVIGAILAMKYNSVPPTANLENADPECDLDYTPCTSSQRRITHALSNSFAFGGSNISLVLSRKSTEEEPALSPSLSSPEAEPVITGIGVVTPIGIGKTEFKRSLLKDKQGLVLLSSMGEEWSRIRGGLVKDEAVQEALPSNIRRRLNRQASFLFVSMKEALGDAGISAIQRGEIPIAYGTAFGCSGNVHRFYSQILKDGPKFCSPQEFNMSVTNAPPSLVARELGIRGALWVFVSDEASWDVSFQWAAKLIRHGRARQVVVSGAEELSDSILAIHQAMGVLETDRERGLSLGEGSVTMVLESAGAAAERGAPIYGSVLSWNSSQDATCEPQDFTRNKECLVSAAFPCLEGIEGSPGSLLWIGPESPAERNRKAGLEAVKECELRKGFDFKKVSYRSKFGFSGILGGTALSAALLGEDAERTEHILSLISARGGVCTAHLFRKSSKGKAEKGTGKQGTFKPGFQP